MSPGKILPESSFAYSRRTFYQCARANHFCRTGQGEVTVFHDHRLSFRARSRRSGATSTGVALAAGCALLLGGCTVDRYRGAAAQFGELTSAATAEHSRRLSEVVAAEDEHFRQGLADNRVSLRWQGCAALMALPEDGAAPPDPRQCRLMVLDNGTLRPLPPKIELSSILALDAALDSYAQSLVLLASDTTADNQRFANSLGSLATSLGDLDGAIRKARGQSAGNSTPKLQAIAGLVAQVGNLYLNGKRAAALKRIIIEGDPLVKEAVGLLAETDSHLKLYEQSGAYDMLREAQVEADAAVSTGDPAQIRPAQDRLFLAVDTYRNTFSDHERFAAIGKAHDKLVAAAHKGASLKELEAAIESLITLAGTLQATTTALGATDGEAQ